MISGSREFAIVATTLYGLEPALAKELEELGMKDVEVLTRAVRFKGKLKELYLANLWLRTAIKVLIPIAEFSAKNEQELYEKAKMVDWGAYLSVNDTFAIDGTTSGTIFTHSKYVALKVKDALADQFRARFNQRPSVDVEQPTLRINIRIAQDACTLSIDSSGTTLNKRGYRLSSVSAPLNECLAAGLIYLSDWDKKSQFIDPMTGSGTLAIEAAMMASNTAPGLDRSFNFQHWNTFDAELWKKLVQQAVEAKTETAKILAMDRDLSALRAARENAERAGMKSNIRFELADFTNDEANYDHAHLILNPPYGERLNKSDDMAPFYKAIGTQLKHRFPGSKAWVLSSNIAGLKSIGLRPYKKHQLYNGALECKFHGFDLYKGSKKRKFKEG